MICVSQDFGFPMKAVENNGIDVLTFARRRVIRSAPFQFYRAMRLRLRELAEPRRALPSFMLIGAQKCGTTSFFMNLREHPQIKAPLRKEVHYFDQQPLPPSSWYRAHFPPEDYLRREGAITGEASPSYCAFPFVPEAAKALIPDCKFIMLLRDPVARAYSSYQFFARANVTDMTFEQFIDRDFALLGKDPVTIETFWRHLGTDRSRVQAPITLLRGVYVEQIKHWRNTFPPEQVVLLDSRDYFRRPMETLQSVATDVLGLSDYAFTYKASRTERRSYPKMKEGTKARLREFYAPYNQRLYEYVGVDFGW
jgi:hypothetical protein